jgi:hypothetical protein
MTILKALIGSILIVCLFYGCKGPSEQDLRQKAVKIKTPGVGMCSGEQVRAPPGVDYILTAGHCKGLQVNNFFTVIDAQGNSLQRKLIAEDPNSDLLLIEGLPNLKGLRVADDYSLSEHVRTFTHGSDMNTYKTEGELVQKSRVQIALSVIHSDEDEKACISLPKLKAYDAPPPFESMKVCVMDVQEVASTALIIPGSSGGMVVDDSGDLVGVASASDPRFSYFIQLEDIQSFLKGY